MTATSPDKPGLTPRLATALLEINATEPARVSRLVLRTVSALFAVMLIWASFAKLDIVAVAEGQLVPQTAVKIVQPAENGIVREILVVEGDEVKKGQVLVRLDPTVVRADNRSVQGQLALKRLELKRVEAQLAGRSLTRATDDDPAIFSQVQADASARVRTHADAVRQEEATALRMESELLSARETLSKLERTLGSYQRSAEAYAKLAKDQLVGSLAADEKQREYLERQQDLKSHQAYVASLDASLQSQQARLAQLRSGYRSELQAERLQLASEVARLSDEVEKQGYREGLLELRAPQDGVVKDLATTTVGAVVEPGTVLLNLVPVGEPLVAEVYIQNQDIGFVREGQAVRVKLSAYPFTKYGMLEGTVATVSADATRSAPSGSSDSRREGETAGSSRTSPFRARVRLATQELPSLGRPLAIAAGMQVQAEIRQGDRTVMEYLISPVVGVASNAGGER
jgi:HlyD family secretion protein